MNKFSFNLNKLAAITAASVFCFSLASCGDKGNTTSETDKANATGYKGSLDKITGQTLKNLLDKIVNKVKAADATIGGNLENAVKAADGNTTTKAILEKKISEEAKDIIGEDLYKPKTEEKAKETAK